MRFQLRCTCTLGKGDVADQKAAYVMVGKITRSDVVIERVMVFESYVGSGTEKLFRKIRENAIEQYENK
jgi:hypothetical protein